MTKKGTLYLIPATLGDESLIDHVIPVYVKEVINKLDEYIVENEKSARRYLKKAGILKPLQEIKLYPLNKYTSHEDLSTYLNPLLVGKDMGVISEAGCPGVADPGAEVVKMAHEKKITVVPLVGPSSLLLALMASGLNGQNFAFNGYLPIERHEKVKKIKDLETLSRNQKQTQLFIETPYRNQKLLTEILSTCNNQTMLCIATDITLPTEQITTQTIEFWKKHLPNINKRQTVFLIQG